MHTRMCVHTYTDTDSTDTYAHIRTHTHTHTRAHTHACTHYTCTYQTHTYTHTYTHIRLSMRIRIQTHTCITLQHTYAHTHTHAHTHSRAHGTRHIDMGLGSITHHVMYALSSLGKRTSPCPSLCSTRPRRICTTITSIITLLTIIAIAVIITREHKDDDDNNVIPDSNDVWTQPRLMRDVVPTVTQHTTHAHVPHRLATHSCY